MRIFAIFVALIWGACAAMAQGLHAQRVTINDMSGPTPAFSILIPVGWQTEGGVIWTPQDSCSIYGFNFNWVATSPDKAFGVGVMPQFRWVGQKMDDLRNCPIQRIGSAREYLELIVRMGQPNAQILDYRARPDIPAAAGMTSSMMPMDGWRMETFVEGGEVLFSYTDEQGRDMRGSYAAAVALWTSTFDPFMGAPGTQMTGGMSLPGWLVFAPNGQLDLRIAEAIRKSLTPDANWNRQIAEHIRIIDRGNRETAGNIADINARANSEISDIIHNGYRDRAAIQDRGQRERVEAIHGVETYNDPYHGGTVQLDNTFRHAWQLNDGSYYLTDDEFFQPGQNLGMGGQRLNVTQ